MAHVEMTRATWRGDLYRADKTGEELSQMTVGLIGNSHVGRRVAKLLVPFGCKIIFSDPYVEVNEYERENNIEKVDFDTLLATSDVVSLHARLTPETRGMMSKPEFDKMKDGAYLINTARSELTDTDALYEALRDGKLRGAALDIFKDEPVSKDDPVLTLPNVTFTPHIAGASVYVSRYAAQKISDQIENYLCGRPMENQCQ